MDLEAGFAPSPGIDTETSKKRDGVGMSTRPCQRRILGLPCLQTEGLLIKTQC